MPTTDAYITVLTAALARKYQDAQTASTPVLRQTLAGLTQGLDAIVKTPGFKTLPLTEATTKIADYFSAFQYSILEEEHPECAKDFKNYLALAVETVQKEDIRSLEDLFK